MTNRRIAIVLRALAARFHHDYSGSDGIIHDPVSLQDFRALKSAELIVRGKKPCSLCHGTGYRQRIVGPVGLQELKCSRCDGNGYL